MADFPPLKQTGNPDRLNSAFLRYRRLQKQIQADLAERRKKQFFRQMLQDSTRYMKDPGFRFRTEIPEIQ